MADSTEERRAVSRRLCRVLDYVGLSARMRGVWMEYGLVTEAFLALRTHLMHRPLDMFKFGSGIEGSTTPGLHSDLDILLLHPVPVLERLEQVPPGTGECYLLVTDPDTPPGFVKLQVVLDGVQLMEKDRGRVAPAENYDVDKTGRLVRNNNTTLQNRLNNSQKTGPAQTCEDENFGSIDYVEAYHCATWPEVASDWLLTQRSKRQNGSDDGFLKEMESLGCFFVGIGHPKSEEKDLQWRISLSSQERTFMFNMTQVQFKCYVLMKIFKEEFIKPRAGKSISSYHCKTALLHVMETAPPAFWAEENLLEAVTLCLRQLLQWTRGGNCPNFFVRKENMFDGKIEGELKDKVEEVLVDLIQRGHIVLFDIKCDKIGALLGDDVDSFKEGQMSDKAWEHMQRIHLDTLCEFNQSAERIKSLYAADSDPEKCTEKLLNLVQKLKVMTSYGIHDRPGIVNAVQYFIPCMTSSYGSNLIACALKRTCDSRSALVEEGLSFMKESLDSFFLSGRLKYASCLFALGQLDSCLDILMDVEKTLDPASTTTCACRHIQYTTNDHLVQKLVKEDPSTQQLAKSSLCLCVSFQPSEIDIAPMPLRYEMFRSVGAPENSVGGFGVYWYPSACVDAKVYLYLLMYLVHAARNEVGLKQRCVSKMARVVEEDNALKHAETAYNLLAWVCQEEGHVTEATGYCMKSWAYLVGIEDKCTSSVHPHHNAVKWHVVRILNELWRKYFCT